MFVGLISEADAQQVIPTITHDLYNREPLTLQNNNYKNDLIHLSGEYYISSHTRVDPLPGKVGFIQYLNTINLYRITNDDIELLHTRNVAMTGQNVGPTNAAASQQQHPYSTSVTKIDDDTIAVAFVLVSEVDAGSYINTYDITISSDDPKISPPVKSFNYRPVGNTFFFAFDQSLIKLNDNTLVVSYAHGNPPRGFMNVINITSTGDLINVDQSPADPDNEYLTLGINQHRYSSMIKLDDDTVIVAYRGPGADGIIRAYDITNGILIGHTPLTHDGGRISYNSLVRMDENTVALAYSEIGASSSRSDGSAHLKLFDVAAEGTITQRYSITYYTGAANALLETDIHHSSLAKISDDTLALAYRGPSAGGFVQTFEITNTGLERNSPVLRHDTYGFFNSLVQVDDDTLALAYSRDYTNLIGDSLATASRIKTLSSIDSRTDTTPPEFVSARTLADPHTIIITATENLRALNTVFSQHFTVEVDGTENAVDGSPRVALASNEIILRVTDPIGAGAGITVEYNNSVIGDRAGNELAPFFSQPVTNNIIDGIPPEFDSASISGIDMIRIRASEGLAGVANPADFTVSGNTVSAASISENIITLIVNDPLASYTTIPISYTGTTVTDSSGNALVPFEDSVISTPVLLVGDMGEEPGQFQGSQGIGANSIHILVADSSNDRIQILDTFGNPVDEFGSSGENLGQFTMPVDVEVDSENIVVSDRVNNRISVFELDGTPVIDFNSNHRERTLIGQIALNPTNIFATDTNGNEIRIFDRDGIFQDDLISFQSGRNDALSITTNSTHIITVANAFQQIQILDLSGNPADSIGGLPLGSIPGKFNNPVDVAINSKYIFVADNGNNRIQIFDLSGNFVHQIMTHDGIDFRLPTAIAANDERVFSMHRDGKLRIVDLAALESVTVTKVSAASGTYSAGDTIQITVKFSRDIDVTGTPALSFGTGVSASFVETRGPDAIFEYAIQAGENFMPLNYATTGALELRDGSITTTGIGYAVPANTTLPVLTSDDSLASSSVMVDTRGPIPTISSDVDEGSTTNLDTISYRIMFDEPPIGFDSADIMLSGTATATVNSVSGTGTEYTVVVTSTTDGILSVSIPADAIQDVLGNQNQASDPYSITVDTTPPVFSLATIINSNIIAIEADEPLAGNARVQDFAVSGNTITDAEVFGRTITLTVTNPINYESNLSVSYTGNTITDSVDNPLNMFDLQPVTVLPVRLIGEVGQFDDPLGIATTPTRIFVADTGNDRIQVLDALGNPVDTFGSTGTGQLNFNRPTDVAANSEHLFVADAGNGRIKVFDHDGTFVREFMSHSRSADPIGQIAVNDNNIFVAERNGNEVEVFDLQGVFEKEFRFATSGRISAQGITANSTHILVSTSGGHQVQILDIMGNPTRTIGNSFSSGSAQDEFNRPRDISVNSENILVADSSNNRIQIFDQHGDYSHTIDSYADVSFRLPVIVTADETRAFVMNIDDRLRIIDLELFEPATITRVSAPSGDYGPGTTVPITVTFDRPVTVTGSPQLALETGGTGGVASYSSGSPGADILFEYTVGVGDTFTTLSYTGTDALTLNGGTIATTDYTTPADLTLPATSFVIVQTIGLPLSDTLEISDSAFIQLTLDLADSPAVSDDISDMGRITTSDSLTPSDSVSFGDTLELSDSPAITDSAEITRLLSFTSADVLDSLNIVITASGTLIGNPNPGDFVLSVTDVDNMVIVKTVTGVALAENMITLTVDPPIRQDDAITVSYMGGMITDAAGNVLAFTARQVTNNYVDVTAVWNDLGNTQLGLSIGDTLTITFPEDTDTPGGTKVQDRSAIDAIFTFQRPIGANYTGVWTDPRTFVITVTNTTAATAEIGDSISPFTGIRYLHDLDTAGGQSFVQPNGVAANSTGFVYVADGNRNIVQIFDPSGDYVGELTSSSGFTRPQGVAVNATDFVFVTNGFSKNNVEIFDPAGIYVEELTNQDGSRFRFGNPTDVEVGADGFIFVVSGSDSTIRKFDPSGTFVKELVNPDRAFLFPRGIAVNSLGTVYVAGSLPGGNAEVVQIFDPSGAYVGDLDVTGTTEFDGLSGIAINSTDHVFVSDTGASIVKVFNPDGTFGEIFSPLGGTQFGTPANIATFGDDQFVISDLDTDEVQVYGRAIIRDDERTRILFDRPIFTTGDFGIFIEPLTEADSLEVADSGILKIIIAVSDSPALSDMVTGMGMISVSDSPAPTDHTTLAQSIRLADSPALSDMVTGMGMISASDSPTPTDHTTLASSIRLSDSPAVSDVVTGMGMISVSDSPTTSDSTTLVQSIRLADSPALSDGITGMGMISVFDSPAPSDSATLKFYIISSDSPVLSEAVTGMGMIAVSDSPAVSDRHFIQTMGSIVFADSPAPSDSASFATALSLSDSPALSDGITGMGMVGVSDSPAPSDYTTLRFSITTSDSLEVSDGVTGMGMISVSDSTAPSDSTTLRFRIIAFDSPAISDEVAGDGVISQSDSLTPSDYTTLDLSIRLADSPAVSEAVTGMNMLMIHASDTLAPSDSATLAQSIRLADSPALLDGVTGMGMISVSDSFAPSDFAVLTFSITAFDSPTLSDVVTGMGMIRPADSPAITDLATFDLSISVADSPTVSDKASGDGTITESDSARPSDYTTLGLSIRTSDSPAVSDVAAGMNMIVITESDSPAPSDHTALDLSIQTADSPTLSDGVTGMGMISTADSPVPSDHTTLKFYIISSDSPALSDMATGMGMNTVSDSPALTDSTLLALSISTADSLSVSDGVAGDGVIFESDSPALSDHTTLKFYIAYSDSPTLSDMAIGMGMISASDSLAPSDSATLAPSIRLADSPALSDGVTGMGMINPSDSPAPSDSITLATSIELSDSPAISDEVLGDGVITESDSLVPSDHTALSISLQISDSPALSDMATGMGMINPSDSPAPSDQTALATSIRLADSPSLSDMATGMGMISTSDSPAPSDHTTLATSIRLTDSPAISDEVLGDGVINAFDSPAPSDQTALSISLQISDSPTLSDGVTGMGMISVSDSPAVSDRHLVQTMGSTRVSDSPVVSDSTTLGTVLSLSDSPTLSDEVTGMGVISVSDSPTVSDRHLIQTMGSTRISDSPAVSDSATLERVLELSDSPAVSDMVTGMGAITESDSPAPSDQTSLAITLHLSDSPTLSDEISGMGAITESDSLAPSDSAILVMGLNPSDSPTVSDSVSGMGEIHITDSLAPSDSATAELPAPPVVPTPTETTPTRSGGGGGGGGGGVIGSRGGGGHPYDVTFNFTEDRTRLIDLSPILVKPDTPLTIAPHITPYDLRQNVLTMEVMVTNNATLPHTDALVQYALLPNIPRPSECAGDEYQRERLYACDSALLIHQNLISYSESTDTFRTTFENLTISFEDEFTGSLSILLYDTRGLQLASHDMDVYDIVVRTADEPKPAPELVEVPMDPEPIDVPVDPEPVDVPEPEPPMPKAPEEVPARPEDTPMDPEPPDTPEPDGGIFGQILGWFQQFFG